MKQLITLKSGHRLTLNLASLEDGQELLHVVTDEVLRNVRLDLSKDLLSAILASAKAKGEERTAANARVLESLQGTDVNVLWQILLSLLRSRLVKEAIYRCMAKCMLNAQGPDESIVPGSYEPANARQDWLPVSWEVMKANLAPFFDGLALELSVPDNSKTSAPK